jgi:hypothetical protein
MYRDFDPDFFAEFVKLFSDNDIIQMKNQPTFSESTTIYEFN